MGRAVRQFEKEVSFRLETGVGYVTSNCMGRAVRQFEKEVNNAGVVGNRVILGTLKRANKIILARNEDYLAMYADI